MSNLALTIAAKKSAESGKLNCAFLDGFVFDVSDDATKQIGESVAVNDFRAGVEDAAAMGVNGYFGGSEMSGLSVRLDQHLVARVKCPIVDELNVDPSVWEGLGVELGKAVANGLVKATLAKVTDVTVANEAELTDAYGENEFVDLYSAAVERNINPAESILILNSVAMAKFIKLFAKATVTGDGDAIKSAYFPNGLLGFARVVGVPSAWIPGLQGVIAHRSAFVIAARPLPSDGTNDTYAIAKDVSGFAFDVKKIVDPKFGTRYIVGECNYGSNISPSKIIRIVEDEQSSDSDSLSA